jgi:hypothetical protein
LHYFYFVITVNFAAARILPHSLLAYRVAAGIRAEKTLPDGWQRIKQLDHQTVDVHIGVTLARFKACENELMAIGGLDILNIEEVKHGHMQITCRDAQAIRPPRPYHVRGNSIVFDDPRTVYWYAMHDGNGEIKFGHSVNPRAYRLRPMSSGNRHLDFYKRKDGIEVIFPETDEINEHKLKERFAPFRLDSKREIFRLADPVKEFLETYEVN